MSSWIFTQFLIVLLITFYFPTNSAIISSCCNQQDTSTPCLSYDSSMMAESLDQALFSFPNLASEDKSTLFNEQEDVSSVGPMTSRISIATMSSSSSSSLQSDCSTYACMSCKLAILNGFLSNPSISAEDHQTFSAQKDEIVLKIGTSEGSCSGGGNRKKRQNFTVRKMFKSYVLLNPNQSQSSNQIQDEVKDRDQNQENSINQESTTTAPPTSTSNSTKSILGVVNDMGCDYRRGELLNGSSDWCGLCNLCWQWRKLPDDYFPNYLNEVNCDSKDGGCLSGFGACKTIYKTITILRKSGDEWKKITIDTINACECQVGIGSPLHSLVAK